MQSKQATTIEEVIDILTEIILESEKNSDPAGYFAALYRNVTLKVKEGIEQHFFENNERMEKLDVIFANRYISAYYGYKNQDPISLSWLKAFELTHKYWPIVLQHLLIGMNAHISLDLGIAAAQVSKGKDIHALKGDFDKINEILSSLVSQVEKDLSEIWPTLTTLLKWTKKVDGFLIDFSMEIARDKAWEFAVSLANKPEEKIQELIEARDLKVANNAKIITDPGFIVNLIFAVVRIGERGTVASRINDLKN